MTEAQIQLQNALTTTFLANLVFLSEYDKELYLKVDELSKMIENGTYKEKYALEFIMESGDFDIYDIVNDKYLYNKNPKKINDDLIKKVQFDEKYAIFNLPEYFLFKKHSVIDLENRFDYEKINELVLLTISNMCQYSNILNDYLQIKKKRIKNINKFIFLGTLLGRHIPRIAKKINATMYLVLERNLEIFRLSLFTVDYTILGEKGVIFSIMDNISEEEKKISQFLNIDNLQNHFIKLSSTGINIDNYIDSLLSILYSSRTIAYDYIRMLYVHVNRTTKVFGGSYNILHLKEIKDTCKLFENIPILYIAAGPSLDENLEWIKNNQHKFFIVTIGAAYKKLLLNNIKIDMIVTIDESDILEKLQFDDESVSKIGENTIILASVMTNERILKKFNKNNLFLFEIFTPFYKNNIVFDGFSVGEITLAILLNLNPKEIYLIGLDLALNQMTGETHSKAANSHIQVLNLKSPQSRDTFSIDESLLKVKGNLKEEVFTTALFFSSIKSTESKISKKNDSTTIYNFSNHGAYFKGTIPLKIEEIEVTNFTNFNLTYDSLNIFLKMNSFNALCEESKEYFIKQVLFLKKEIKNILKDIENKRFKTFDDFSKEIFLVAIKISENNFPIINQIIVNYYQMVVPYLYHHFNDLEIKHETIKLQKIKMVFLKQLRNIIDDYILCINRIIKK